MDTFYFLTVLCVLAVPLAPLNRLLVWRPLLWLGMISYALYLFHEPARYTLFWIFFHNRDLTIHTPAQLLVTLAALCITFACAWISWVLMEKPLIARAHRRYKY